MATTSQVPAVNPIDRMDVLTAQLGQLQNQLLALMTTCNQEHQAVDERYMEPRNHLLRRAQETFNELQRLAAAHQQEILPRGKRSSRRGSGTLGWRAVPRLVLHVDEQDLIARLKEAGQCVYRTLVNRTVRYELDRNAFLSDANRAVVSGLEGVEVTREDSFYVTPNAGFRMSTTNPLWPNLAGLPGPEAFTAIMTSASDS